MKQRIIAKLLEALARMLTPEVLREVADAVLDLVEDRLAANPKVMAVCSLLRAAFNVPDDD